MTKSVEIGIEIFKGIQFLRFYKYILSKIMTRGVVNLIYKLFSRTRDFVSERGLDQLSVVCNIACGRNSTAQLHWSPLFPVYNCLNSCCNIDYRQTVIIVASIGHYQLSSCVIFRQRHNLDLISLYYVCVLPRAVQLMAQSYLCYY